MDLPGYPSTCYAATAIPGPPCPRLEGRGRSDVCVVGGGIAGCSAALALAERGYQVVLLEAERLGWGASGRNGGQALPGTAIDQADLVRLAGAGDARRVWDMSVQALEQLKRRITRHRIDCEWIEGQMYAAVRPRQWRLLQRWHDELERQLNYAGTRLIDRQALRATLASERYIGALHDRNGGHLHPLRYTLGLAAAARQAGAKLYEGSRVRSFERSAHGPVVAHTDRGRIDCRYLLLAGNAWLGDAAPALAAKRMAIASHMVATEPLGEQVARELIANDAAVSDTNWVLDYFRRSRDHRLLFGGGVSYSGHPPHAIAPAIRRRMLRVFPQLRGARIDYAWGCFVDITLNRAPHFGRLAPEVLFLQGFSGHGLALAGLAGTLAAEAIAGTAERFDVFARLAHRDFPGGPLRRPLLVLGMLWYRLRDLL